MWRKKQPLCGPFCSLSIAACRYSKNSEETPSSRNRLILRNFQYWPKFLVSYKKNTCWLVLINMSVPTFVATSRSVPASIKSETTSVWPCFEATCNGVMLCCKINKRQKSEFEVTHLWLEIFQNQYKLNLFTDTFRKNLKQIYNSNLFVSSCHRL